ncbi:MAG: hypothetical protein ABW007_13525 [Chitinophagaceae bacterium]
MSSYFEQLGLDGEQVRNLAWLYNERANQELQMPSKPYSDETTSHLNASSFLISAIYTSLYDPLTAQFRFKKAASIYRKIQMPIWMICAICSADRELLKAARFPKNPFGEIDILYQLFLNDFIGQSDNLNIIVPAHYSRVIQIPETNLFYGDIEATLQQIAKFYGADVQSEIEGMELFIKRMNEIFEIYKTDEHWQSLEGSVIPFSPVMLAIALIFLKRLYQTSIGLAWKYAKEVKGPASVLFFIANDILMHSQILNNKSI